MFGVTNQLLIVFSSVVLSKLVAIYDESAPDWATNAAGLPWNQSFTPIGTLLFCVNHPLPDRVAMLSKPSPNAGVATAVFVKPEPVSAGPMPPPFQRPSSPNKLEFALSSAG